MSGSARDTDGEVSTVREWHVARAWQTNAALLLIGIGLLVLSIQLTHEYSRFSMGFSGVSGWSAVLYVAAVLLVLTQPTDRFTFPMLLAVAVVCRLAPLFSVPHLSSDIYRYVWDGVVQHAHISPYRYVPGDAALSFLRAPYQELFDNINRRDYAHTIYPPAAQALFYLITWISPTVLWMKAVMVLFEGVTLYALVKLLSEMGIHREQSLLYAWCPLLFWEIAGSGHLDSAAIAFICLAMLARYRRRMGMAGMLLAVAVLLKLYPVVLFPALYRRGDWKMFAAFAGVIAAGYAAYSSVGMLVFGFLGGYVQEEGLATGARYFLLELAQRMRGLRGLSTGNYLVFCSVVFAGLMWWCWRRSSDGEPDLTVGSGLEAFPGRAFALAVALMLLFSPHYAWYIVWLIPFFALMPNLPILVYLMGFFYLYTTALAEPGPKMFLANEILYGAVLVATLLQVLMMRSRRADHTFGEVNAVDAKS